ncbi:MAG TPA: DUF6529 family protein [Planctomycetota bacterium]|nr:DUF6529 family protein [Planctomycetota bacterium]HRR79875.1 DUF6529 family protein [Planctomycetota bacterium]HRT96522.1 DUF6529 family protein [Planctomycetota bacterium]
MNQFEKTYVALGFVALALVEFATAMRVFGCKGDPSPRARLLMRVHRIGGYVFLVYALFLAWVGLDMMERYFAAGNYAERFDARVFTHALLAFGLIALLLLKIFFIRVYRAYRPYVPLLGIAVAAVAVIIWLVAGLMFLAIMGGVKVVG